LNDKILSISRRTRATPFTTLVEAAGVKGYTVYNHMLLPTEFISFEEDYWHLCEHVQVWDVSAERQVEIIGPDAMRLVQLMTPRDIRKAVDKQCLYVPLCNEFGSIINDPIAIRHSADHWWLSIADSDVKLWAQGLATGFGLDVKICEPDVFPLAVQGPKAEDLVARLFGEKIRDIRFFRGDTVIFKGKEMYMARSGWSKQGGFEIYLNEPGLGEDLWDELFRLGEDLNVRAGCPNLIERVESGLLSYGNDIDESNNPFECGFDQFINLDADIESLSLPILREMAGTTKNKLVGLIAHEKIYLSQRYIEVDGRKVGELTSRTWSPRYRNMLEINGKLVGELTSQIWSPRYRKQLAFAMMDCEFLADHSNIEINGVTAQITALPFSKDLLNA